MSHPFMLQYKSKADNICRFLSCYNVEKASCYPVPNKSPASGTTCGNKKVGDHKINLVYNII